MHKPTSDLEFLEMLYTEHYRLVYKLTVSLLRKNNSSLTDAADITQDVFIIAATKIDQLKRHPNPVGWLIEATKLRCSNYFKRRARHKEQLFASLDQHKTTDDDIAMLDTRISLQQVLSPEDYSLVKAYFIEKRPTEEICKKTGMSPNRLRVRMHRLKKYLSTFFVLLVIFASTHNI